MFAGMLELLFITVASLVIHNVQATVERIGSGEKLKHINIACGKSHALITYVGDPKAVVGFGINRLCYFDSVPEQAKFSLIASYENGGPNECVMKKRSMGNIYHLKIQARFSEPDVEIEGDETAMLSCNFETLITSQAETIQLIDPVQKPIVVEDHRGRKAKSHFSLAVHHVDGSALPEVSTVGTEVELIAMMKPGPDEVAFQVILCHADMPDEAVSFPIIIDGCGTEEVFPKDKGFVRYKLFAKSPSFGLFRAVKTRTVQFRCEFLVCREECDRYSCPAERLTLEKSRKRRSIEETSSRMWAKTRKYQVFLRGEAKRKTLTYGELVTNDTKLARLVLDTKESTLEPDSLTLPVKFLVVTIVGGVLALAIVILGVWVGWRYATRSIDIPVRTRSASRQISEPVLINPPTAASTPSTVCDWPDYDLAL